MSLDLWPAIPRLAVGSHPAGSGKGCLMNIISWGNGDVEITDMPACTHPALSTAAIILNDRICTHRDSDLLCVDCSAVMFGYEPLLVGTEPPEDPLEAKRLAVSLAVALRPHVEPLWRPEDTAMCSAAFDVAAAWLDCPCDEHVKDAATLAAFTASYAVSYAAAAASSAASDAARAVRATAATAATASACYASNPRAVLDTLIDTYYTFTGRPQPAPNPDRLAKACAAAGLT